MYASTKQVSFIRNLLADRASTPQNEMIASTLDTLDKRAASRAIEYLLGQPKVNRTRQDALANVDGITGKREVEVTKPGVFRKDDDIFLVKPNQQKTRLYAKRLVKSADRLTEGEKVVKFEWDYAAGAIFTLTESDRVSLDDEEIRDITTRYGRCICCGRVLKAAESVQRMIGPVCARYFA